MNDTEQRYAEAVGAFLGVFLVIIVVVGLAFTVAGGIYLAVKAFSHDDPAAYRIAVNDGDEPEADCHDVLLTATDGTRQRISFCEDYIFRAGTAFP